MVAQLAHRIQENMNNQDIEDPGSNHVGRLHDFVSTVASTSSTWMHDKGNPLFWPHCLSGHEHAGTNCPLQLCVCLALMLSNTPHMWSTNIQSTQKRCLCLWELKHSWLNLFSASWLGFGCHCTTGISFFKNNNSSCPVQLVVNKQTVVPVCLSQVQGVHSVCPN